MRFKILRYILFFNLIFSFSLTLIQRAVFCETVPSKAHRMGGLMEDEVISIEALRQKQLKHDHFLLIDARGKKSYDISHIEGAVLSLTQAYYNQEELFRQGIIPQAPDVDKALAESMNQYPKDISIVTYCNNDCQASAVLLFKLKKLGFHNVKAMEEGLQSWEKKNYPVTKVPRP